MTPTICRIRQPETTVLQRDTGLHQGKRTKTSNKKTTVP